MADSGHQVLHPSHRPKPQFLQWFAEHREAQGQHFVYHQEENQVVVIPSLDAFPHLSSYIEEAKVDLLKDELARFGVSADDFGRELTSQTFDEFFTIVARDYAIPLTDLPSFKVE